MSRNSLECQRRTGSLQPNESAGRRALAALSFVLAAACGPAATPAQSVAGGRTNGPVPSSVTIAVPSVAEPVATPSAAPSSEAPTGMPPFKASSEQLARFHRALWGLAAKERKEHVRVLWIGDSHGQADFWSGAVRKLLAERWGAAGPGFVHVGYKNYRHDGIKLDIKGKWKMRPKKPVDPKRQGDGVYGLGGLMMGGYADGPRVELSFADPIPGGAALDLCFRFHSESDAVAIAIDGKPERTISAKGGPLDQIRHETFRSDGSAPLVVRPIGKTELCGLVAEADETSRPGVVLDTLAINGMRYGTALAWDGEAWAREVARRKPSLVVLELGTNEAGDGNPAYAKVEAQVGELLDRVRSVAPEVDCVVVSPTDRADAETRVAEMRKVLMAAAKKRGCYWFDAWQHLGGEGAFAKLRDEPEPKVQPDGIHLTIKGYRELGKTMFDELVKGQ